MHSSISSGPIRTLCIASRSWRLKSALYLIGKLDFDSCGEWDFCLLFLFSRDSTRSLRSGNRLSLFALITGTDIGVDVPIVGASAVAP